MRLPGCGMMLADPGFLVAEFIQPSQHLKVEVVTLFQPALRRMRGHREISEFHGAFPLVVTWRVVARGGKYPTRLRLNCDVSIARRGIRATLPRRHRYSSPGFETLSSYPPEARNAS